MPRMHMTFRDGLFAVRTYNSQDGAVAKEAGAIWHGPHSPRWPASTCEGCAVGLPLKEWWFFTRRNRDRAVRLKEIADQYALEALGMAVARLEVSRATGEPPLRQEPAMLAGEAAPAAPGEPVLSPAAQALMDVPVPSPRGLVYKPYQRAGIAFMLAAEGGSLLADEPGLGKTIQVLGLINAGPKQRSLVVVPASLRINWLREAVKWLVRPARIHVVGEANIAKNVRPGIHGVTAGPGLPQDMCEAGVEAYRDELVIVNYDRVRDPDVLAQFMACRWDLLAADEGHFLKNPKALRTVACLGLEDKGQLVERGLRQQSDKFVAMTGTPLPNRPVEMWPILHAVSPVTFPSFWTYARRYCNARKVYISRRVGEKWDFTGSSNLAELQEVMRSTCMVRRLKADVLKDLPPKIRQIIPLPFEDYSQFFGDDEDYGDEEDDEGMLTGRAPRQKIVEEIEAAFAAPEVAEAATPEEAYSQAAAKLGKAAKVSFTNMSKMRERLALAKLPAVLEICDNRLEEEKKIIIFAHHHSVIEKILAHYNPKPKKQKTGKTTTYPQEAVAVYGPVDAMKRDLAVTAFQDDPKIRVFVGSIAAAGVGLTLTAASTVIFAEIDWVPGNVVQAEDRAHRIGQEGVVNVLHVVVEKSLDARMVQLLVAKADVADRALDRKSELVIPEAGVDWAAEKIRKREEQAKLFPPVTPLLRELVQEAMAHLTRLDPDRASEANGAGFNKMDGDVGRALAGAKDPSPAMVWNVGVKFANKYRRQLGALAEQIADEASRIRQETELRQVEAPQRALPAHREPASEFLRALPLGTRTKEDIDRQIEEERDGWYEDEQARREEDRERQARRAREERHEHELAGARMRMDRAEQIMAERKAADALGWETARVGIEERLVVVEAAKRAAYAANDDEGLIATLTEIRDLKNGLALVLTHLEPRKSNPAFWSLS